MAVSNLNSVYMFSIYKDENNILRVEEIKEVDLKAFGGTYNFKCGNIQAFESNERKKIFYFSRFYDQLLHFRNGILVTLLDLPKVSFL